MPAQAGIYLRLHYSIKASLDSGRRRNDERKSRLPVNEFKIPRFRAEDHSVTLEGKEPTLYYFFQNSSLNSFSYSATLRNMSAGT
jgi:hypothetical protein